MEINLRKTKMILLPILMCIGALTACAKQVSFSQAVMPILEHRCLACHRVGAEGYEISGFSVESYEALIRGTKYGPVIEPGYSYASTLQVLISHRSDPAIAMPRATTPLTKVEIETIGTWIDQGALDN